MKKITGICAGLILACAFAFSFSVKTQAAEPGTVVVLGADLSADQRASVLDLMGITEEDLNSCTVLYVTNEEEHQYLDGYVDSSIIGTKALTSVMMTPAASGDGIHVTTTNVTYCTTGMYRNALLTAGVEDRNVFVAAPSPVSGTAGLIGAVKAYEATSGETVSSQEIDTAIDEMMTTGEISENMESVDNEDVEAFIAWLKNLVAVGDLDTSDEESIRKAIEEGEEKFGVTLTEDEKTKIVSLLKKLDDLGLDGSYLTSQAEDLYEKYGMDIVNHTSEAIDEAIDNAVEKASKSFFESLKESFSSFFSNLFKKD